MMVFFLSPTCPICKTLLPVLKSMQRSEKSWLSIILASDGDLSDQHRLIEEQNLGNFSYVLSPELGLKFEVGKLPYAVLIDSQGILKSNGLVNSREHLESLIEAKNQGVVSLQQFVDEKLSGKTAQL